jgi:hypothetical protein
MGAAMPNGDGGNLKMFAIFNLHDVDREQWHMEVAHHLRFFADQIETNGLDLPVGKIVNDTREQGRGRAVCEYNER